MKTDPPLARILIVDDEAAQMKALCDTLSDHGYETKGFTSGKDALAALAGSQFDLLLSDLMMPGMDGIALLATALRKDPDLVGIIMTGEGTINTAVEAMKTGALDYILKPFRLSAILPVLTRALTVRRLRMEKAVLESHLRERTVELEAANQELEAFSYSVSHDLRAPLRAITGFAQILTKQLGSTLEPDAALSLDRIRQSGKNMGELIDGLLAFSRFSRQPLTKSPIDTAAMVRQVLDDLRPEFAQRRVEIEIGEMPSCEADPTLLQQVFANLLSNAVKYSRERNPAMVRVGAQRQNGECVYFVQDNGAGFEMEYATRLFQVFQRLHTAEQFEGTGVGLAIVHRIIHRHGGRIWAEAQVDRGATFYFTLCKVAE